MKGRTIPFPILALFLSLLLPSILPPELLAEPSKFTIEPISPEQKLFFETKIRPILSNSCLECHSSERKKRKGNLSLDHREEILKGGDNGSALKPGAPNESLLIRAVEWADDLQMPPKKKLSAEQIADLKRWVQMGAPDPRLASSSSHSPKASPDHWAFQPILRPPIPPVSGSAWIKNPIDQFILAKLEEKQMCPASPPETGTPEEVRFKKEALLRRAFFDLIGLPPSPAVIRYFVHDPSPNAFEKIVDALLRSPFYGERWARHWMDTARYSDTSGVAKFGEDYRYPYAWGYRDWLIKAFNEDMPYHEFILHQLAADLLSKTPTKNWAALGFLTIGTRFGNPDDLINERIDTVGRGLLGLTLACARCHDHKFDPITQADYYALHGVFRNIREPREGPIVDGNPDQKNLAAFEETLSKARDKAYAAYLHMVKRENARLRKNAAAYFEWACIQAKGVDTAKDRESAAEFLAQRHLDHLDTYWIRGEMAPNFKFNERDPILGPFVALSRSSTAEGRRGFDQILSGSTKISYHPLVIRFLKSTPNLPTDPAGTSALFAKFWERILQPIAGKPIDPSTTDFLAEIQSGGGIYQQIWNQRLHLVSHPDLPLMELAVFPWRLVGPAMALKGSDRCAASDPLEIKLYEESRGHTAMGSELQHLAELDAINMLKMSSREAPVRAMIVEDLPQPVDSVVYPRGNKPGPTDPPAKVVPRRFIEALSPQGASPFKEGSGRLELARAIASEQNPLTARVLVNRVWMYFFGEGLVRTPDDLGHQAGSPSHPELLDFLSWWFMQEIPSKTPGSPSKRAWSLKSLHKAILMSNTYQQSSWSTFREQYEKVDPGNNLLWHANIRRLDFDAFRDALISMAGEASLDRRMYGPPVNLFQEPFSFRRTIYGYIDRADLPDVLSQFDAPNPQEPNTKRASTLVPQQALFLMNSPFTIGIVQKVVSRPEVAAAIREGTREGITAIYQIVFQRTPNLFEFQKAEQFLLKEAARQKQVLQSQSEALKYAKQKAEEAIKLSQKNAAERATAAVVNHGEMVSRVPLSPWESFVQALLFCNEAAYLN